MSVPRLPNFLARGIFLVIVLLCSLLLAACGDKAVSSTPAPTLTAKSAPGKVAVIMSGVSNDGGWNSLGFEATVQLRRELGLTVDVVESVTADKLETTLRDYASRGYGLIFIHNISNAATATLQKIAPDFPATWFIQINGQISGPNLASVIAKNDEAIYLIGMASALANKGKKIFGMITGSKAPNVIAEAENFRQGLQVVTPDAELLVTYLTSWQDKPGAVAAATEMYGKGAEVIYGTLSFPDQPILKIAQTHGKQYIGYGYDLYQLAPDTILTNILGSVPTLYLKPASLWKDKKLEAKVYRFGLKEQAVSLAPFRGKLTTEDEARIEKAKADIIAGTLIVNPISKS